MTSGNRDGKRYPWQSWPSDSLDGMPPKRRRLVVWALLWLIILSGVLQATLDAADIAQPWRSITYTAVLVAIFAPLIRGAVTETRALRAEGVDLPRQAPEVTAPTRKLRRPHLTRHRSADLRRHRGGSPT